jgi:hypothetical protein
MLEYIVLLAALASLLAAFVYIHSMFIGGTKPNRVSWLMWAIAPLIGTAAALSNGVGWAVLPVFMAGFSPFLIFVASFFATKAYWKLSTFDYVCGVLSAFALFMWWSTKDADIAIVFAITSDALASIPTILKAKTNPETESVWPFIIGTFGAASSLVIANFWTFSEIAFPIYLIGVNTMVLFALYQRRLSPYLKK